MIKYRGVLTRIGEVNRNGTIITREAIEGAIKEFNEVGKGKTFMHLRGPIDGNLSTSSSLNLEEAKGVVRDFTLDGDQAILDIELLDVEHSDLAQIMLDSKEFKFCQISEVDCCTKDDILVVSKMRLLGVYLTSDHADDIPPPERLPE